MRRPGLESPAPALRGLERRRVSGPPLTRGRGGTGVLSRGAALFTFSLRVGSVRGRSPRGPGAVRPRPPVTGAVDRESPAFLGSLPPGSRPCVLTSPWEAARTREGARCLWAQPQSVGVLVLSSPDTAVGQRVRSDAHGRPACRVVRVLPSVDGRLAAKAPAFPPHSERRPESGAESHCPSEFPVRVALSL